MATTSTVKTLQGCHGDEKYDKNVYRDVMVTTSTVQTLQRCHGDDKHDRNVNGVS